MLDFFSIKDNHFFTNFLIGIFNMHLIGISIGDDNFYRLNINKESLNFVMNVLNLYSNFRYKILCDISCIDYLGKLKRFQMNYILLSLDFNSRIIVSVDLKQNEIINSITNIFNGSNWMEREVWDMFGIYFSKHKDLRRILTDYGFEGHPFRKDFPLNGYMEIRYDEHNQSIVYEAIELTQKIRFYSLINPIFKKHNI